MVTKAQLVERLAAAVKSGLLVPTSEQKPGTLAFWTTPAFCAWSRLDGTDLYRVPLIVGENLHDGKPVVGFSGYRAKDVGPVRNRATAAARALRTYLLTGGDIVVPTPAPKIGAVPNAIEDEEPVKVKRGRPRKLASLG